VREAAGYLAYRIFDALFGLLPEPAMRRGGEALGTIAYYLAGGRRRLVLRHAQRVLGEDDPALRSTARRMFASYGRYWAEVFWVRARRKQQFLDHGDLVGQEHIDAAVAAGRGIVLALPHLGNWEAAGAKAEQIGIPVLAVAERLPNRRIVDWFVKVRNQMGIEVVLTGKGSRVTRELVARLEVNGTVALVADRDLTGRGVEVEYFGERTTIPAGPVALAERTGAALIPVGAYFKEGRGHRFVVHPPLAIPDAPTREERVALGAQRCAEVFEDIIRVAPHQWHLFVPNWPSDREEAGE
jgi:phosphatidylinositol dimannoside acyltransferase